MKKFNNNEIDELSNVLKKNGVICVPTDTVYGLCCRINNDDAYKKLAHIKNRPLDKSFPVMCSSIEQIKSIAKIDKRAERIIKAFMPGPITLVLLKRNDMLNNINNRGLSFTEEIAIRMAPNDILKSLIEKTKSPIFMTSANQSGEAPCENIDKIEKTFPSLDGVLLGNPEFGISSTIVDLTKDEIKIQREGPISLEQIIEVLKR